MKLYFGNKKTEEDCIQYLGKKITLGLKMWAFILHTFVLNRVLFSMQSC